MAIVGYMRRYCIVILAFTRSVCELYSSCAFSIRTRPGASSTVLQQSGLRKSGSVDRSSSGDVHPRHGVTDPEVDRGGI
jgi:hypothetical protein